MKEKRNTEWGEGQEKWSDRELLQLSFFPSIWRAQRKIGDEYGGSSSHSLLTFFSQISSTFFQHFHSSVSISFIIPVFNPPPPVRYLYSSFPCDPIIHILFPSFLQIFFPPLSSVKLLITLQPPHPTSHFSLISCLYLLYRAQSPHNHPSHWLCLWFFDTRFTAVLSIPLYTSLSFCCPVSAYLFIGRCCFSPVDMLLRERVCVCVCEHSYPSRALPFTQDQLVFLSLHLSHTYWHKHTHTLAEVRRYNVEFVQTELQKKKRQSDGWTIEAGNCWCNLL